MFYSLLSLHRVEDHDDLVPIFNRQSDMLSQAYGDFFLAELIEAQDDTMKCLVAEVCVSVCMTLMFLHSAIGLIIHSPLANYKRLSERNSLLVT